MQITITNSKGDVHSLEVDDSFEVEILKALIEADMSVPIANQALFHNGVELKDPKRSLASYNVKQYDVIMLKVSSGPAPTSASGGNRAASTSSQNPAQQMDPEAFWGQSPEAIRNMILSDPRLQASLRVQNPVLLEAATNDPAKFSEMIKTVQLDIKRAKEEASLLSADPFDVEAQKKIEEMIRMQNVHQNMESAMEYNPESFGRVHMLYVKVLVNGCEVKAFVDSGAQATIITPRCAEACGIMRLIDKRFAGVAVGVGTAKIIGRIHSAPLKIGEAFLPAAFTVLEGSVDMLFGLDMLKRHQAVIDLKDDVLRIAGQVVPFLPENEIPNMKHEQFVRSPTSSEPEISSPHGNKTTHHHAGSNSATASKAAKTTSESGQVGRNPQFPGNVSTTPAASTPTFPESSIQGLMSLGGVSREQAIRALTMANGNVDVAANFIFSE